MRQYCTILSKNGINSCFLNSVIILVGQDESNFAACFSTGKRSVVDTYLDGFLVSGVQNLYGLHDDFHAGSCAFILADGFETATVVYYSDGDAFVCLVDVYPEPFVAFLAAQGMFDCIFDRNLY